LGIELVFFCRMEYTNADFTIGVDIWMPHLGLEDHVRRVVGVCVGEFDLDLEESTLGDVVLVKFF
jgi:hypothetical protein